MDVVDDVLQKIEKNYSQDEIATLKKAYYFTKEAHRNQKRASGEDYFTHPCAVAEILIDLGLDCASVTAAFLHDVLEDTSVSASDIEKEFGQEVLSLVDGVTKLEKIEFKSYEEEQAENFKKIFVSMAKDIRVIIIKLADRLHNMRSLNFLSPERQKRMAHETIEIYAPLAGRLGISQIKCELEDLCLKYLDPDAYEYLSVNIHSKVDERREFVAKVVSALQEIMQESGIEGEVYGRPKHFYSIYKKMKNQGKTLDQIYDLTAVRAIVKTVDNCYELLGKIHKKWKPIPGRIKDYIATPKPNMYQGLHTTVVTSFGQIFEIQIRTEEMHKIAEYGIAAHWKYKENKEDASAFENRLSWIREVMEWQGGIKDSKEFIESIKGDIYSSEVLVFTPKGEVVSLPKKSTPVDFAYHIHTEVGHKCVGAKVNGKIVPLNTTLQVGDMVEIITNKSSKGPSWDWLKIAQSSGAKAKIRSFFKRNMVEEKVKTGKSIFENDVKAKGYTVSQLLNSVSFETINLRFGFATEDEMYAAIGVGAIPAGQIISKLVDLYKKVNQIKPEGNSSKLNINKRSVSEEVTVNGLSGMLVRFAGCCNPVPGDKIIGFVSKGRGVTVHRANCPNMKNEDKARFVNVEWTGKGSAGFTASIKVTFDENATMINIISGICMKMGLTITSINGRVDQKIKLGVIEFTVRLNKSEDLDTLIEKIQADKNVVDVFRTLN